MLPKATLIICFLASIGSLALRSTLAQDRELGQYVPINESYELPIPITLSEGPVAEVPNRTSLVPVAEITKERPESPQPRASVVADSASIESEVGASSVILLPARATIENERSGGNQPTQQTAFGNPVRTLSSLALVLGLFFLFLRIAHRYRVPVEEGEPLFDTLGRVSLLGKPAHIVRFGSKLLVLAKTSKGLEKLTELSDPQEVEQVIELCRSGSEKRLNQGLRNLLSANSMRPAA